MLSLVLALLACHPSSDSKVEDTGPTWSPQPLDITLFVVKKHSVCVVGDPCQEGQECVEVGGGDAFDPLTVAAVVPSDPRVTSSALVNCLTVQVRDTDLAIIEASAALAQEQVAEWTGGSLVPTVTLEVVDEAEMPLTPLWGGWWLGPWDMEVGLPGRVDTSTDGTWITTGLYDPDQGMRLGSPLCGGTLGADWGLGGAGYSWVPRANERFYDCTDAGVYNHEWLHQVEFSLWHMTPGRTEKYWDEATGTHVYPACGEHEEPVTDWFPTTHECATDPDSPDCGLAECSGNEAVNQHVLQAHWNPQVPMVTNYCRDGVQDWDETQVDSGGRCGGAAGPRGVSGSRPLPR